MPAAESEASHHAIVGLLAKTTSVCPWRRQEIDGSSHVNIGREYGLVLRLAGDGSTGKDLDLFLGLGPLAVFQKVKTRLQFLVGGSSRRFPNPMVRPFLDDDLFPRRECPWVLGARGEASKERKTKDAEYALHRRCGGLTFTRNMQTGYSSVRDDGTREPCARLSDVEKRWIFGWVFRGNKWFM